MTLGESAEEMILKVLPTKQIVDLSLFRDDKLSTKDGFKSTVQQLCSDNKLPLVFPLLPDYSKARLEGFVTNKELRDQELSLPSELLDSTTYLNKPELRGPMEEIIIEYERERIKQGLTPKEIRGEDWSPSFKKRFNRVHNVLKPTNNETNMELDAINKRAQETLKKRFNNEGKLN